MRSPPVRTSAGKAGAPEPSQTIALRNKIRVIAVSFRVYLSSQTSSMRQLLYWLFTIIVIPLTQGCQQVPPRR